MKTNGAVLVAEDDPDQLEMLCSALTDSGLQAVAIHNGDEVLPRMEVLRPALAIIDIHMPGLNGLQILQQLRKNTDLQSTPVILVSAYYLSEKLDAMILLGVSSRFSKPYEMDEMLQEVRRLTGFSEPVASRSKQ